MMDYQRMYGEKLKKIRNHLEQSGRSNVRIIAVSKTHGPEKISYLLREGQRDFGENRQNEARDKIPLVNISGLSKYELPIYHHIGPLQSGHARQIPGLFSYVHGVSSLSALNILAREALKFMEKNKMEENSDYWPIRYLFQIKFSDEKTKIGGFSMNEFCNLNNWPENEALQLTGFMTMGIENQDPTQNREIFHQLREMRDQYLPEGELSMGMSNDWEIAVQEGATMIRIGSAIFGKRNPFAWKKEDI